MDTPPLVSTTSDVAIASASVRAIEGRSSATDATRVVAAPTAVARAASMGPLLSWI